MTRMLIIGLSVIGLSIAAPFAARAERTAAKAATTAGTVKSVSTQSLTVASGTTTMTFTIDATTKFVAKGLSTKSAKGKITAIDAVGPGDAVRVTYNEMGGGVLHAATVRVTAKSSAQSE